MDAMSDDGLREEPTLRLANEFETVYLRLVPVGNGRRLEISNARTGESSRLDATVLAALARLSADELQAIVRAAVELDD